MKIEVGKSYKTQDGRKMTVSGQNPNVGEDSSQLFVATDPEGDLYSYFLNGNYTKGGGSSLCLVKEWPEPKKLPLEASDIVPGCAVREKGDQGWRIIQYAEPKGVNTAHKAYLYSGMVDHCEILYPGETEWKPCWKDA